jgi:hypothetical protein
MQNRWKIRIKIFMVEVSLEEMKVSTSWGGRISGIGPKCFHHRRNI